MPTKNDIEEAKAYLRKRLEAETSMKNNLEKFMLEAASRIVEISYQYTSFPIPLLTQQAVGKRDKRSNKLAEIKN